MGPTTSVQLTLSLAEDTCKLMVANEQKVSVSCDKGHGREISHNRKV